jgi:hypothetical protein
MNCCSHCRDAGTFFNDRTAKKELKRYKRKGPQKSTRLLLDEIRKKDLKNKTLLDIGGGIGAISFELLESGIKSSTHVDASAAYLKVTKGEAANRGLKSRITHQFGDFTELSGELDAADIVTLDRVICCYPDMRNLVAHSTKKAGEYYGVVYPRERWFTRLALRLGNFYFKLRGSAFRTYLHHPPEVDAQIRENGFHKITKQQTILWESVLYERDS